MACVRGDLGYHAVHTRDGFIAFEPSYLVESPERKEIESSNMIGEFHSRLFNHGSCQRNESERFYKRYVVNAQMLTGFHVVTGRAGPNLFSVVKALI